MDAPARQAAGAPGSHQDRADALAGLRELLATAGGPPGPRSVPGCPEAPSSPPPAHAGPEGAGPEGAEPESAGPQGADPQGAGGPPDPETRRAREVAGRALAVRARSSTEMTRLLRRAQVDEPVTAATVQWLSEQRLLDDAAFAQEWVEGRQRSRPRARSALRAELRSRGVAADVTEATLAGLDPAADQDAAAAVARRRARTLTGVPPAVAQRRLSAALLRRGFDGRTAATHARQALAELGVGTAPRGSVDGDEGGAHDADTDTDAGAQGSP